MVHLILECLQVAIELGLILMVAAVIRRLPKERSCNQARRPTSFSTEQ